MRFRFLFLVWVLGCAASWPRMARAASEEFVGPFASWANLQRDFGARGDGKSDDTSALQNALDALKGEGKRRVLWIPAGTYRLTRTLEMVSHLGVSVLGEDPRTTRIVWDGADKGTMLHCNGVRYSRFGRLTWDGRGRAGCAVAHQWDGHTESASTHNEHADEIFQDVGFGIRAGVPHFMDAECAVRRCRFERCSSAGVSIESFNALDWWIWDCVFERCAVGVTNEPGAGHFHVYRSFFHASSDADLKIGNTMYFGIRGNTSLGSRAFFLARRIDSAAPTTLQNNLIVAPTGDTAISIGNLGPCLLLDNTIEGAPGRGAVRVQLGRTTLAAGNTFSVTSDSRDGGAPLQFELKALDLGVSAAKIAARINALPLFAPRFGGPVIEVPSGSDGAGIQRALDQAATQRETVVHLEAGEYPLTRTLRFPARRAVQLVGEGVSTRLVWKGDEASAAMVLEGPSRATLRDFELKAGNAREGLRTEGADGPGARVWVEQGEVADAAGDGLLADGLDNARLELRDFGHSGCQGVAVHVRGGARSERGEATPGRTFLWGGASSNNALCYDVQNGARLMAQDIWYEGAPPRFLALGAQSSGSFTLSGATTATGRPGPNQVALDPDFAATRIAGFRGDVALVGVDIGTNVSIGALPAPSRVFVIAHGSGGQNAFFRSQAAPSQAALYGSTRATPGGGAVTVEDQGALSSRDIAGVLTLLRSERPAELNEVPREATDVRLFRVVVVGAHTSIHITP